MAALGKWVGLWRQRETPSKEGRSDHTAKIIIRRLRCSEEAEDRVAAPASRTVPCGGEDLLLLETTL
jgi:hypothetical protein